MRPLFNMQLDNSISVRYLNVAGINDLALEYISGELKSWGMVPAIQMNELVYKKHVLGKWLASALVKIYGVTREHFSKMKVSSFGKPYIPNHSVSFNISHSSDFVICAASGNGKIGIDIEQLRAVERKQYEDCFSKQEWEAISCSADQDQKLLELWTKKESLIKADGRGLQIALADVMLAEEYGVIRGEEKKWHFRQIPIRGYTCHVCTEFPVKEIESEQIIFDEAITLQKSTRQTSS